MTTYGLEQVGSRGGQTDSGASANNKIMGKDDFLHLLVAQLECQDPLNPMDSTGFTAQLAQFSSLEQLQNVNIALGSIGSSQSILTNSQAVGFIGKTITAVGDTFQINNGRSQDLQFSLDRDAAGLFIKIYDGHGSFMRQIEVGPTPAGQQSINWDGRDYLNGSAPDGDYRFEVSAIDEYGNSVPVTQFASGLVEGVNFKDGQAYLRCGGREIPMGNVVQVLSNSDLE
jgi:flagellar basal-body rod modification protein FlgD